MSQERLSAAESFLQPRLAFFREKAISSSMAVFNNGLGNVEQFLADNEGFVEWDFKRFQYSPLGDYMQE
jgi:hypothetical protein